MTKSKKSKKLEPKSPSPATSSPKAAESKESQSPTGNPTTESPPPPKEDFESHYMKRVTAEFADDIDKLRRVPDFGEHSVPILIQALKQGSKGFNEAEKEKIMGGR